MGGEIKAGVMVFVGAKRIDWSPFFALLLANILPAVPWLSFVLACTNGRIVGEWLVCSKGDSVSGLSIRKVTRRVACPFQR